MSVRLETKYIPPPEPTLPAMVLQCTQLVGSYMIWIGTTDETEDSAQQVPPQGSLTRDWACAMPPTSVSVPAAATSLFRSSSSDLSLAMAQRLARRFKKQIFLSVDVPPSFMTLGEGPRLVLAVEKAVVDHLKSLEDSRPGGP